MAIDEEIGSEVLIISQPFVSFRSRESGQGRKHRATFILQMILASH